MPKPDDQSPNRPPEGREREPEEPLPQPEGALVGNVPGESEAVFEAVVPLPPKSHRATGLVRSGAIVAAAIAISNLLNVVFQLVTARLLPPPEYSLLVSLFAILLIANVPILSLQARIARDVAQALAAGRKREVGSILHESLWPMALWGAAVLALGIVLAVPFSLLFNVERVLPAAAVAAAVIATLPLPIAWGGLQGSERFAMLGFSQLTYAVLKVAVGVGLAALGFGAAAIVFGIALATIVTLFVSLLPLAGLIVAGRGLPRSRRRLLDAYTAGAAAVLVLIAALTNMDLLASRAFLSEGTAGLYAAISVAARALLLLPIVATTVLFPRVAVLRDLTAERSHLLGGLAAVAALSVLPIVAFFAIPEQLLEIGFGHDYVHGASWLGPLAVAMMLYALVEVYMFHFLALGRLHYGFVLGIGLGVQLALMAFLHASAGQLIAVQIAVAGALLAVSEGFDRYHRKRARRELTGPSAGSPPGKGSASGSGPPPRLSATVVMPTFDNAATLPAALDSLAAQDYGGEVDVLCVDGGSGDATREIARSRGATVIDNPARNEEAARALGLEAANGELVLLLDADDELPSREWLRRLVEALDLAPDLVSADCLYHQWRPQDPPVTRLCALIGGTDPLAIDLGWADRWATHLGRWTGLPVEVEEVPDALLVRVDPERPPPMGSNGFLVRREALLRTRYRPYVHSDVVGDLAEQGWRFARVRGGIVHHYAPTLRAYAYKARRRARRSVRGEPPQRRGFRASKGRLAVRVAFSLSVVGPALAAIRGYRARPDAAWALLPVLYVVTVLAYLREAARARLDGWRRPSDPPSSST